MPTAAISILDLYEVKRAGARRFDSAMVQVSLQRAGARRCDSAIYVCRFLCRGPVPGALIQPYRFLCRCPVHGAVIQLFRFLLQRAGARLCDSVIQVSLPRAGARRCDSAIQVSLQRAGSWRCNSAIQIYLQRKLAFSRLYKTVKYNYDNLGIIYIRILLVFFHNINYGLPASSGDTQPHQSFFGVVYMYSKYSEGIAS